MPAIARKKRVHSNGREYTFIEGITRGMVFWAKVGVNEARGSETRHDGPSPWVIVSSPRVHSRLPIVQAVPLTTSVGSEEGYRQMRILVSLKHVRAMQSDQPALNADSLAEAEQTRVLSHERLIGHPVAKLSSEVMFMIDAALLHVLQLEPS